MSTTITRRAALVQIGAGGLFASSALAQQAPTPGEIVGPFYPIDKPLDSDADLTRIAGNSGRALGQMIEVSGRVMNRTGAAVSGARLEIWQANAAGRYSHPSDDNTGPLDPNFQGYAALASDADGEFRFLTVKPGGYRGGRRGYRTPHIHFDIAGKTDRTVVQMYFPGEAANTTDYYLSNNIDSAAVIARELGPSESGVMRYRWDVVLRTG